MNTEKRARSESPSQRRKRSAKERQFHAARDTLDESIAKINGVLGLITSFAFEEHFEDVSNACWLIHDELERLDEAVSNVVLTLKESA